MQSRSDYEDQLDANNDAQYNLMMKIRIVNVIASTKFNSTLGIEKIASRLPYSIYEPEIFPGLVHRSQDPKATIIMFDSGKITSIGTSSEKMSRSSLNSICFELCRITKKTLKLGKISTENIVATVDVGSKIDLMKVSKKIPTARYRPGGFPGVIIPYKKEGMNIKLLAFSTGKIISVGAKGENYAKLSILETYYKIKKCLVSL